MITWDPLVNTNENAWRSVSLVYIAITYIQLSCIACKRSELRIYNSLSRLLINLESLDIFIQNVVLF